MGEKILRMFVGLFVGIWVARYLGPDQFGLLSYAQSFVFLFVAISTLGLDGIVVRELVKDETRRNVLVGTAFGLKFMGALAILPVLGMAIQFTGNDSFTNLLIFIIASATIFQSFNAIDLYFQSKVLSKYVALANTISLGLSSVIKITLILTEAPLIAFAIVIAFDALVLAIGLVWFYLRSRQGSLKSWQFDLPTAKSLLKDSWPLILSGLVISIYMKVDQVMIKEMMNSNAVGQYAAAVRLSEAWYFIPMALGNSLFPALVNAKKNNAELYRQRLQNFYTLRVWRAVLVALPVTLVSDQLILLLYGPEYEQAGSVLMVHVWAGIFVFLGVAYGKFLAAENLTKKAFYRTLLGAVINVALNLVFIAEFGIVGAAMATFIGQFSANYLYDFFDRPLWPQIRLKNRALVPVYLLKRPLRF